jgi:hypothetical protein
MGPKGHDLLLSTCWANIVNHPVRLAAAFVTIVMVRKIDANQERRIEAVSNLGGDTPELSRKGDLWTPSC